MAQATIMGYPRLGARREFKFALELYWKDEASESNLLRVGKELRTTQWRAQKKAGIDLPPSNDFSFYDQVLDMSALLGVVPERYDWQGKKVDMDTYFAMARGMQKKGIDVPAAEMTKWFDTNYHYIVPEFSKSISFKQASDKPIQEYLEAQHLGFETRPVLVGPVSYLLLGKCSDGGHPLDHIDAMLDVYIDVLKKIEAAGASFVQLDEPFLVADLEEHTRNVYQMAYSRIRSETGLKIFVTTPFGELGENLPLAVSLPIDALHVDLVRGVGQLDAVLDVLPRGMILAAGVVNGRNIWRNNLEGSLQLLERAATKIGNNRLWVSSSCSLLHVPYDLEAETKLDSGIKKWLAFAEQKLDEISTLTKGLNEGRDAIASQLVASTQALENRKMSPLIHESAVKERLSEQPLEEAGRAMPLDERRIIQKEVLGLPMLPTTTVGSFPQTLKVRQQRAAYRKGSLSQEEYDTFVKEEIASCITFQEEVGLDVLVHGEFERNDMVEFFGEKLRGFAFTEKGWVQSYGSRGVKPPIIYGDVLRETPMTLDVASYAQSLTKKPVKGMLTGPVTILQWSFVRDDQPRSVTAHQIALALQDEVLDLENAGLKIIQIDEPAFREGAPIRRSAWRHYFPWAVQAFRLVSTGVKDSTQIHTHMCYSEFNDSISAIKDLDADVISIETSRSQMELLEVFVSFKYPGDIGPGVYDIHSPRVPERKEIEGLLKKACEHLASWQVWVNPDCGLKTRDWPEVRLSLTEMVKAAHSLRD